MELIVTSTLPVFTGNFEAVKAQLLEGIQKYEIEVTEENLPEAKKMATELNKLSTVINKVKSNKVKEISAPIEIFKNQVSELVEICQNGREKILAQVKVFEDQTRIKVKELIDQEFASQLDAAGIRHEFRNVTIEDLVGISKISKSGSLTKGAKDDVAKKVADIKALQDKVDMRLLQLENAGLKAGLKSPLRREHVEPFIMAPDDQYDIHLSRIISIEVSRQMEAETKFRQEQEQKPQLQPAPLLPPRPLTPPMPLAAPVYNQERLHQMRQHLGDEVFFQMFKIVYQPISDRAIQEAVAIRPDLANAVEWAKGTD